MTVSLSLQLNSCKILFDTNLTNLHNLYSKKRVLKRRRDAEEHKRKLNFCTPKLKRFRINGHQNWKHVVLPKGNLAPDRPVVTKSQHSQNGEDLSALRDSHLTPVNKSSTVMRIKRKFCPDNDTRNVTQKRIRIDSLIEGNETSSVLTTDESPGTNVPGPSAPPTECASVQEYKRLPAGSSIRKTPNSENPPMDT